MTVSSKRKALAVLAAFATVLSLPAPAADKVSLAYTQTLYSAHIVVAREKGFFAKHNLDVDFKLFTAGRCLDAVMAGAANMCATAETPMTAAVMALHDEVWILLDFHGVRPIRCSQRCLRTHFGDDIQPLRHARSRFAL